MTLPSLGEPVSPRPLRLWPGVGAVGLQLFLWFVVPILLPDAALYGVMGGVLCGVGVLIWWLFFSRARWTERIGVLVFMVAVAAATRALVLHPSIVNGMMGMMFGIYVIPALCLALVGWAVLARRLVGWTRYAGLTAAVLLACGVFGLLRTDGMTGAGRSQFAWRWEPTAEQKLLAKRVEDQPVPSAAVVPAAEVPTETPAKEQPLETTATPEAVTQPTTAAAAAVPAAEPLRVAEWPGFRGARRNGIAPGVRVQTDWNATPPAELWRRPVGPGWSSFAVDRGLVYTQEQRGESEVVACYRLRTGEPVWAHKDAARFWESNAGAGPRATPTLHNGHVYTLGATGIVNALDARTGAVIWSRNAATDTNAKVPEWGFSGSPVVVDDIVVVAASGHLAAYELANGTPRWKVATGGGSYSSPHLMTIDGVTQIVFLSWSGATSVAHEDGSVLWKHALPGAIIVQPTLLADGGVLVTSSDASGGLGTRRLAVKKGSSGWTVDEVWTSKGLKPYFNDLVVHNGYVFGFDGGILSCIDLKDGARKWKGGRYGHGQMLLLPEQNALLVLSEEGEVALVGAGPEQFTEITRFKVLNDKTWNHPVIVGNVLLVRNSQEMAAFRLPADGS